MKVLIATPLYPPDIGGPATYSKKLFDELPARGIDVDVLSFGEVRRFPKIIRHMLYFWKVFWRGRSVDIIFALDNVSVGVPTAAVSIILRKPLALRLGGDFLWEDAVGRGALRVTLRQFYENGHASRYRPCLRFCITWVFRQASVIMFSTGFQRDINSTFYGISIERTRIVENALPYCTLPASIQKTNEIIYAGRFITLKNPIALVEAVADSVFSKTHLVLIGSGPQEELFKKRARELGIENRVVILSPMPHDQLLLRIQGGLFCVLPSFSDVSPNLALECIALNKAVIVSHETGLQKRYPHLLYVDPMSVTDIREKMKMLLDDQYRRIYEASFTELPRRDWNNVAEDIIKLFYDIVA